MFLCSRRGLTTPENDEEVETGTGAGVAGVGGVEDQSEQRQRQLQVDEMVVQVTEQLGGSSTFHC